MNSLACSRKNMFLLKLCCACLWVLSSFIFQADGYCMYRWIRCYSKTMDLTDMVFVESYFYNKREFLVFNSTVNVYVGQFRLGMEWARMKNADSALLEHERGSVDRLCNTNARVFLEHILVTAQPNVKLSLVRSAERDKPAMLMCSAYNFYPKMIKLAWYRGGQRATSDVSATEELADGDWNYQIHSHLEFTPKAREKISCVVDQSLKEPLEVVWESSIPSSERNKVAIGTAGLMLGLLVCSAGLLYYRKKTQEWTAEHIATAPLATDNLPCDLARL